MGLTRVTYPNGLASFGSIILPYGTGKVFWVNSSTGQDAPSNGDSPDNPFATIAYAVGRTVSGRGDTIYAAPNHSENVIAAAGIDIDNNNVSIVGLGTGATRSTINFTTAATADLNVDGASVSFHNILFDATAFDGIDAPLDINGADCLFEGCHFVIGDSAGQADDMIVTAAASHRLKIHRCTFDGGATTGPISCVDLVGANDGFEFVGNKVIGTFSGAIIDNETGNIATNVLIAHNYLKQDHATALVLDLDSAVTGMIAYNVMFSAVDPAAAGAQQVDAGACSLFENYGSDAADASGILEPSVLS